MGHQISAFIGKSKIIELLADNWINANIIELPQGFAMLYLTMKLWDDIEELADIPDTTNTQFRRYSSAIEYLLEQHSKKGMLAYIETDYFGGYGYQSGVLYINGVAEIEETEQNGIINKILNRMGVYCLTDKDEFDSLELYKYRNIKED